jgi:hypothetical protein
MGQAIQVESVAVGETAIFDTDRTMTGQDGMGFSPRSVSDNTTTQGNLARRLFETDSAVDYVFVLSNQVTARREGGWSDENLRDAESIIRHFFVFYEENRGSTMGSPEA